MDYGKTASDVLQSLTGGWNPDTIVELRKAFMRRAGVMHETFSERKRQELLDANDLQFLRLCSMPPISLWTLQEKVEQPFPLLASNLK